MGGQGGGQGGSRQQRRHQQGGKWQNRQKPQQQQQQQQQQRFHQKQKPKERVWRSEAMELSALERLLQMSEADPKVVLLYASSPGANFLRRRKDYVENSRKWIDAFEGMAGTLKDLGVRMSRVDINAQPEWAMRHVLPRILYDIRGPPLQWESHLPAVVVYAPDCKTFECGALLRPKRDFGGLRHASKKEMETFVAESLQMPEVEVVSPGHLQELVAGMRRWETLVVAVSQNEGSSSYTLRHAKGGSKFHVRVVKSIFKSSDAAFWSALGVKKAPSVLFFTDGQAKPSTVLTSKESLKNLAETILEKSKARLPLLRGSTLVSDFRRCAVPRICVLVLGEEGRGGLESLLDDLYNAFDSPKRSAKRSRLEELHQEFYKLWAMGRYKVGWVDTGSQKRFLKHLGISVPKGGVAVVGLQTMQTPPDISKTYRSTVRRLHGKGAAGAISAEQLLEAVSDLQLVEEFDGNAMRLLTDISPSWRQVLSEKMLSWRARSASWVDFDLEDVLTFMADNLVVLSTFLFVAWFAFLPYLWVWVVGDDDNGEPLRASERQPATAEAEQVRNRKGGDVVRLDAGTELGSRGLLLAVVMLPAEKDASSVESVDSVEAVEMVRTHATAVAKSLAETFRAERRMQFCLLDLGLQPAWEALAKRAASAAAQKYQSEGAHSSADEDQHRHVATLLIWKPGRKSYANLGFASSEEAAVTAGVLINRIERALEGLEGFTAAKFPELQ